MGILYKIRKTACYYYIEQLPVRDVVIQTPDGWQQELGSLDIYEK